MHVSAEIKQQLVLLTAEIDRSCDAFEGFPGLHSLYFWTKHEPLTGLNLDCWPLYFPRDSRPGLFRHSRLTPGQASSTIRSSLDFGILTNGPQDVGALPLVQYIHREFKPVMAAGEYHLLVHNRRPWVPSESGQNPRVR
jgi:hypothetical protein